MTKSRTVWTNVVIAILGMVELNFHLIQNNMGEYYGIAFMVISAINIALRAVTTKPLSERK